MTFHMLRYVHETGAKSDGVRDRSRQVIVIETQGAGYGREKASQTSARTNEIK